MSMMPRYSGEFLSRSGVKWKAVILQDSEEAFIVHDLTFPADDPLLIEWDTKSKEEPICGSSATLKIESPGDRTFIDLYSIAPGKIRLDIYREDVLYWSGCLDPEFYEEPYDSGAFYDVELTFSDFGILSRLRYNLADMKTAREILADALKRSGINFSGIDETMISTSLSGATPLKLADLTLRSDNFFDEDGEALTLYETIEAILQPLALRMIQKAGKIFIYDLNGLYHGATPSEVEWESSGSVIGTDRVYNNAIVTWSTYAQSGNLSPEEAWTESIDPSLFAMGVLSGRSYGSCTYFSYHYSQDLWDWCDATDSGFTLWISQKGKNLDYLSQYANYFRIVEQYDGQKGEGVAIFFNSVRGYKVGSGSNWQARMEYKGNGYNPAYLAGTPAKVGNAIFKTVPVWIPPIDNTGDLLIKIVAELLFDVRFNPFEHASNWMKYLNQEAWYDEMSTRGNFVYIPVKVKYQPNGSDKIYVWANKDIICKDKSSGVKSLSGSLGTWKTENDANAFGFFAYYDPSDRGEKAGVLGWHKNRPAINPHTGKITTILSKCEDGQYIPYPNFGSKGGKLWIEVLDDGWIIADGNTNLSLTEISNPKELWGKLSWILMKLPEVEIINNQQFDQAINTDDVEYKATINESAKDKISIDTTIGTKAGGLPTARGAFFNSETGKQIQTFTRAGRTTQAEELLIGTLYSQFADRRATITGEMRILTDGLTTYTEQNQEGRVFIVTGEEQNMITDTSEATIVELRPDEYTKA